MKKILVLILFCASAFFWIYAYSDQLIPPMPPEPPQMSPPPPPPTSGPPGPGLPPPGIAIPDGVTPVLDKPTPPPKRKVPPEAQPGIDYMPEEIIVKFKKEVSEEAREHILAQHGACKKGIIPGLGILLMKLPPQASVVDFVDKFNALPQIEYAEPNYIGHISFEPNDLLFPNQWGLHNTGQTGGTPDADIDAPEAWDRTLGSATIKIAILDTGIDPNHIDLSSKVVASANCVTSTLQCGSNPSSCTPGPAPDNNGHGTEVAGIAAAITNNGTGIAGTGGSSALINVKIGDAETTKFDSANGIKWAADNGAAVINMSYADDVFCQAEQDTVNYAWNEKGVILVAVAGNDNNPNPRYPAAYENVIAVASTDHNDVKAPLSNYGSWVHLAAPGVNIWTTVRGNAYSSRSGTSYAAPFVSGVAALVRSIPEYNNKWLTLYRLLFTADQIAGTGTLWKYGRVNARNAVAASSTGYFDSDKGTYVFNYNPNNNHGTTINMWVTDKEYLNFISKTFAEHNLSYIPANAKIVYSGVWLYACDVIIAGWVDMHAVTGPWNEMTITWNNQPPHRDKREAWKYISTVNQWYWFDITPLVAEWRRPSANLPNNGFIVESYFEGSGDLIDIAFASDDWFYYAIRLYVEYVIP